MTFPCYFFQHPFQVSGIDIKYLATPAQYRVKIRTRKHLCRFMVKRRRLGTRMVRVAMTSEPMVNDGSGKQGKRIDTDREQHEGIAERMNRAASQHRRDRHGTGWWMHAPEPKHQQGHYHTIKR